MTSMVAGISPPWGEISSPRIPRVAFEGAFVVCGHDGTIRGCEPLVSLFVDVYCIDGGIAQLTGDGRRIGLLVDFFGGTDLQDFPLGQYGDSVAH